MSDKEEQLFFEASRAETYSIQVLKDWADMGDDSALMPGFYVVGFDSMMHRGTRRQAEQLLREMKPAEEEKRYRRKMERLAQRS